MRHIREPERFSPPAEVAAFLREQANRIERGDCYVAVSIRFSFATREEITAATSKRKKKAGVVKEGAM